LIERDASSIGSKSSLTERDASSIGLKSLPIERNAPSIEELVNHVQCIVDWTEELDQAQ
jgi:hypothetical protein